MTQVFGHPWLGALFDDPEVSALWDAQTQLAHYKRFEAALADALEACGRLSKGQGALAAKAIHAAPIDIHSLAAGTATDGVPVPEFVRQLRRAAPAHSGAIHDGATSQDVLDTALALTLQALADVLTTRLRSLDALFADVISKHGDAALTGRTRMQAALPIKVSDRVEIWRSPVQEHIARIAALGDKVARLQLGGAVGTRHRYGQEARQIADHMAAALGLFSGPVWHTNRTGVAEFANQLSLISGSLGKLGQDVALMAQQGIDDIVLAQGGGSSAMPHKSNPIKAELLVTLARFNAVQIAGLHQSLVHEQERSGAAWMLEWMILPQMACAAGRSIQIAVEICADIVRIGRPSAHQSGG